MKKRIGKRPICLEEYVPINGISQFLYHLGTRRDNPVMLFLHGGPGSVESLFTRTFQDKWEEIYTVVHWDQRGAGKTLARHPDQFPTMDVLLQDLYEVVQYLKAKYSKRQLVILGHSWGSVLGSLFIRKHPEDAAYYVGVGQVVNMLENERVGYQKVKEAIVLSGDRRSLKQLESIGEYPGENIVFNREFLKKCGKVRKLQGKYNLAVKIGIGIWFTVFQSPIFRFSDITSFLNLAKANAYLHQFLGSFNLREEPAVYQVPIYYILGGNDWQAPFVIAQQYFEEIAAPRKGIVILPDAGHMTMMDQPDSFYDALRNISRMEESNA
ncbi:alpha/beta fold hydrolase [Paenibacillus mucilaginosus]|uniref:prolyl aminopeptidase n=2 Tax=Paenibacillus mucilaginosus TaxID=61624 RepID=H6NCD9_9BACL|nr:alpha/beta hydrolase [Paenibacillus mucilaginosus]AEI39876.1 alpha/beta hydrolase fold protein [Paenibacillus mucilaginosus KNP414]AFC28552.1 alpha/beta hydrolase fold protein [Paenibacillus mucilaginosus 3016]MCG7217197.1 alpha/beta hydrolase [Paenibacillus mucilaginosus]WDM29154.1 alpha/beta hydrolase [Paenibacillus mucilaginosus]WFA17338.1 alpha/beta hydrolase [Paenibacillus mucilaginosus]